MKGWERGARGSVCRRGLAGRVAEGLREGLRDPRYLAERFIREHTASPGRFLGDGTPECPWVVLDDEGGWYAFYVRGQELVNVRTNGPDTVVCDL
jgi:hypothetical protein